MSWIITGTEKTPVDPYFSNVSLLLHGDGTNGSTTIVDSSPSPKTVTAFGNAQISTAVADPFGNNTGVIAFDGTGDTLQAPHLALTSTDFTIEAWVRFSGTPATSQILVTTYNQAGYQVGTFIILRNSSNQIVFANALGVPTVSSALTIDTWYHFAAVYRHSITTAELFINGISVGTASFSITNEAPSLHIGGSLGDNNIGTFWLNGYIDDLRITKGVARYTSNFTPPTAPFPDI